VHFSVVEAQQQKTWGPKVQRANVARLGAPLCSSRHTHVTHAADDAPRRWCARTRTGVQHACCVDTVCIVRRSLALVHVTRSRACCHAPGTPPRLCLMQAARVRQGMRRETRRRQRQAQALVQDQPGRRSRALGAAAEAALRRPPCKASHPQARPAGQAAGRTAARKTQALRPPPDHNMIHASQARHALETLGAASRGPLERGRGPAAAAAAAHAAAVTTVAEAAAAVARA
jgi:hypothetical protein